MDEATQRFARESVILLKMLGDDQVDDYTHTRLAVTQAKTVERASRVLVKQLARKRDQLQPGGTSDNDRRDQAT